MNTYLYRAVSKGTLYDAFGDVSLWPGAIIGRQSGYLSRSGAARVGSVSGVEFEIVRSEPVMFLTRAEKIQKQINDLHAELAALGGS